MNASVLVIKCFQLKCNNLHSEYFYFGYFEYILTLTFTLLAFRFTTVLQPLFNFEFHLWLVSSVAGCKQSTLHNITFLTQHLWKQLQSALRVTTQESRKLQRVMSIVNINGRQCNTGKWNMFVQSWNHLNQVLKAALYLCFKKIGHKYVSEPLQWCISCIVGNVGARFEKERRMHGIKKRVCLCFCCIVLC